MIKAISSIFLVYFFQVGYAQYLPANYSLVKKIEMDFSDNSYLSQVMIPSSEKIIFVLRAHQTNKGTIYLIDFETYEVVKKIENIRKCGFLGGIDTSGTFLYFYSLKNPFLIKKMYELNLTELKVKKVKDEKMIKCQECVFSFISNSIYSRNRKKLIHLPSYDYNDETLHFYELNE